MELMFKTENGSLYYLGEDGFWTRKKFNGEVHEGWNYLGSIDYNLSPELRGQNGHYQMDDLFNQMRSGIIPGFTPEFVVGNAPFGIKKGDVSLRPLGGGKEIKIELPEFNPRDVVSKCHEGRIDPSLFSGISFYHHIGHRITKVYQKILAR